MPLGKKILVVDDEPDVLRLLAERLAIAGYRVIQATSGRKALEAVARDRPDLIIMDIAMPELNGAETADMIRRDPLTEHIPIMFLTCLFTKQEEKLCGHVVSQNFFMAKPYDIHELLSEISRKLGMTEKKGND